MDNAAGGAIIQLIPIMIIGSVYAFVVYLVAKRRKINPWGWSICALIPIIGLFVALIFLLSTLLSILDRLNTLEEASSHSAFS